MKKIVLALITLCSLTGLIAQNVGIGTNSPLDYAKLDISSTTAGLQLPRLSTTQRNTLATNISGLSVALSAQYSGMIIYDTDTKVMYMWDASKSTNGDWVNILDSDVSLNDADADPNNELQTISKSGSTVSLSNGGGSFTDDNTTYDGSDFVISGQAVPAGNYVTGADAGGALTWSADQNTTYDGNDFVISGQTVPAGNFVIGADAGGALTWSADQNTTYDGTDFVISGQPVIAGNFVTGADGGGAFIYGPDNVTDADADPSNELQTISQSGTNVTLSNGGGSISVADNDNNSSNELQTISKSGSTVSLSNSGGSFTDANTTYDGTDFVVSGQPVIPGNFVTGADGGGAFIYGPDNVTDADADPSNELQTISQSGTNVTLSNGGGSISVADNDNNSSNELQTISKSGSTVSLSNGGGSFTDANTTYDGTDFVVSGQPVIAGNFVTGADVGGLFTYAPDNVTDADADPNNELQTLGIAGNTISLSNGGGSAVLPLSPCNIDANLSEDFESGFPAAWTNSNTGQITIQNCANTGSSALMLNGANVTATSPVYDFSGCVKNFEFSFYFREAAGSGCGEEADANDFLRAEYFNGSTWVTLESFEGSSNLKTWQLRSYNIQVNDVSNFQVRFRCTGSGNNFDSWLVDDIGGSSASNIKLISGSVEQNGAVAGGTGGFTVSRQAAGEYLITFSIAFSSIPGASATQVYPDFNNFGAGGSTLDNAIITGLSETQMKVVTGNGSGSRGDREFTFTVIGLR